MAKLTHIPILVTEWLELSAPQAGDSLLDATLGHGGHSAAFLEATGPSGTVVGLDADEAALKQAQANLSQFQDRVTAIHANFAHMKDAVTGGGILHRFSHVLFDLGVGSHQLDDADRSFSFAAHGALDMRYGQTDTLPPATVEGLNHLERRLGCLPSAREVIKGLTHSELAKVIRTYGEERYAQRIATALKEQADVTTAKEVAGCIVAAVPAAYRQGRIHPATRTFLALRLAVNRELEVLAAALPQAVELVRPGGTISVLSFHSLEDRIVKNFFREHSSTQCHCPPSQLRCTCERVPTLERITKKPVTATAAETTNNPRARSAKLRVVRRLTPT